MPAEPTSWGGGGRQHLAVHHSQPQGTDLVLCCLSLGKWWLQTADGKAKQYSCEKIGRVLHCLHVIHTHECTSLHRAVFVVRSSELSGIQQNSRTAPSVSSSAAASLSYHTFSNAGTGAQMADLSLLIKTVFLLLYFTLFPSTFSWPTAILVIFY